jgi:hypothetical protein
MKNKYVLLIVLLIFSVGAKAFSINKFQIQTQYLKDATTLNIASRPTPFKVDVTIGRDLKSYGYELVDISIYVVYRGAVQNSQEAISPAKIITGSNFSGAFTDFTLEANLPASKTTGVIELVFTYTVYSNSGTPGGRASGQAVTYFNVNTDVPPSNIPFDLANAHLFMSNPSGQNLRKADYTSGGQRNFSAAVWANVQGITSLNNYLYIVQANNLHKVDQDGNFTILGQQGIWPGTEAVTSSSNGYIYIAQNARIHKMDPNTGQFTIIGNPEWANTEAMVAYNGYLYISENGYLYKVNENTGTYIQLNDAEWAGTQGMASGEDGWIYLVQNGYLHRVNAETGVWNVLGERDWLNTNTHGVAYYDNSVYILQNRSLHRVNKLTGSLQALGNPDYSTSAHLTPM